MGNGCFDFVGGVTTRRGGRLVVGTDGPDVIFCVAYNLTGSKGVTVKAGAGNDFIIGSPRADHLSGGKGCDRVEGLGGNDVVDGGKGNDNDSCIVTAPDGVSFNGGVFGGDGDDLVKGGKGDDDLDGGENAGDADVCEGGPGADTFAASTCETESQGPP